ncbi:HD-GYP domain-containing protein [Actinacidiphila glaucinigra]|uniref:HD-GYP domain-containing protein n=1 Tax=Actinacidiphila glaucinigra TaxID=235986 RepID=UPI002DD9D3A5|nr:HD-GYP domain-containing protein [Actinacidiphila glaucinigra]WSD65364.1 HD-GYP domain-containing protein [Actinacidiphila glaucinigra]
MLPAAARVYIPVVVVSACGALVTGPHEGTPWATAAVLAVLYAAGERTGASLPPVLFAAALLLPPGAAALVAVPGGLLAPVRGEPRPVRRVWHAAQLALATAAAAQVRTAFGDGPFARLPGLLVPALAAVLAFCLFSAALTAGVLITAERTAPSAAWREALLEPLAPHLTYGLVGLMAAVLWQGPYGAVAAVLALLPTHIARWVVGQARRERAAHRATVRALVQAVEIKDRYTRGHSERVGRASALIAREIGLPPERVEALRLAGILHDIGKLGVPTRVLRKDSPLTPEERRIIELHPGYGHEMVRGIAFLDDARTAILHHHERLDGSGYPYGLAGEAIPSSARLVAVADAFDAMTSTRAYQATRGVDDALGELRRCAGSHFDPLMVQALIRAVRREGWNPAVTADEPEPFAPAQARRHARRDAPARRTPEPRP